MQLGSAGHNRDLLFLWIGCIQQDKHSSRYQVIALHLQGAWFAKYRASHFKNNILCLADATEMPRRGNSLWVLTAGLMTRLHLGQKGFLNHSLKLILSFHITSHFQLGESHETMCQIDLRLNLESNSTGNGLNKIMFQMGRQRHNCFFCFFSFPRCTERTVSWIQNSVS